MLPGPGFVVGMTAGAAHGRHGGRFRLGFRERINPSLGGDNLGRWRAGKRVDRSRPRFGRVTAKTDR